MIKTISDKWTLALFEGKRPARFRAFQEQAERKLQMLDSATAIDDLRSPPGNRLEKLTGDREGSWSVRINKQWRVVFSWREGHAWDVEIVDYH